jgi:hypothetical protein
MPFSPRSTLSALAAALVLALPPAAAAASQSGPSAKTANATPHQAARTKPRLAAPAEGNPFAQVSSWFSYGGLKEADIEREAPGVQIKARDPQEDELIVFGERRHRDFEGAAPEPNLTSPQALDAAQPMVPGMGDSCSYKSGCFDSSQVPLRSAASSLFGN